MSHGIFNKYVYMVTFKIAGTLYYIMIKYISRTISRPVLICETSIFSILLIVIIHMYWLTIIFD